MVSVPKLWPGETFVVLGCGPSLSADDVHYVHGKARVIAINASYELAPWANVLYCHDAKYWQHLKGAPAFGGLKFGMQPTKWPDVTCLRSTGAVGLELQPHGLRHGHNSGYQAVNLAVHLGAAQILLLGFDMKPKGRREHFRENYPSRQASPYPLFLRKFETIVAPLTAIGVEVINCTPGSALACFPRRPLREVLADSDDTPQDQESNALEVAV